MLKWNAGTPSTLPHFSSTTPHSLGHSTVAPFHMTLDVQPHQTAANSDPAESRSVRTKALNPEASPCDQTRLDLLQATSNDALVRLLTDQLAADRWVKIAGVDVDGVLRGKLMARDKFLSALQASGMGLFRLGVRGKAFIVSMKDSVRWSLAGTCMIEPINSRNSRMRDMQTEVAMKILWHVLMLPLIVAFPGRF